MQIIAPIPLPSNTLLKKILLEVAFCTALFFTRAYPLFHVIYPSSSLIYATCLSSSLLTFLGHMTMCGRGHSMSALITLAIYMYACSRTCCIAHNACLSLYPGFLKQNKGKCLKLLSVLNC